MQLHSGLQKRKKNFLSVFAGIDRNKTVLIFHYCLQYDIIDYSQRYVMNKWVKNERLSILFRKERRKWR